MTMRSRRRGAAEARKSAVATPAGPPPTMTRSRSKSGADYSRKRDGRELGSTRPSSFTRDGGSVRLLELGVDHALLAALAAGRGRGRAAGAAVGRRRAALRAGLLVHHAGDAVRLLLELLEGLGH